MNTMSRVNSFVARELQRINSNIKQRNADESMKRQRWKNVEEFLKFTSNLIPFLGNSGVTFNAGNSNDRHTMKFKTSVRDYKGAIAADMFSARFASNAMGNKRGVKTFK